MPVSREDWQDGFRRLPDWPCPTCKKGRLKLIPDTLQSRETGPSVAARDEPAWEPEWITERFIAMLQCDQPGCGEIASVSGSKELEWFEDWESQEQWSEDVLKPMSITPAPTPIRIAENTPNDVRQVIEGAARLLWSDREAAANKLRQAIELLMDHRKVIKTRTSKGKRHALSLHARIQEFAKKDRANGDLLLAVKWIGNSGSHPGGASRDTVFDIFDMVEHVLEDLYGTTRQRLMEKAKEINKHKGVKKPRRWRPRKSATSTV